VHPLDVLLAEDNVVNQKLAVRLLETLGHHVTVVGNGAAAVEASLHGDFDLILMDMQMPVMGGIEATRAIRKREAHGSQHQIIVAMTANAMQGDRERCLDAGMDGYVSKPIDKVKLIQEIDRVIVRAQSRMIWLASNISLPAELKPAKTREVTLADLDMTQAMDRWDGDRELYMEVAMGFLTSCPKHIQNIQRAIYEVDSKTLVEEAHALAGAAGNLSAMAIEHITRQLMAAAENNDFFLAATLADQLSARVTSLGHALKPTAPP
jgi:CheY-like chemotaxis protein/HPt (histidine-containing phosphotransfer) domain-containing protein